MSIVCNSKDSWTSSTQTSNRLLGGGGLLGVFRKAWATNDKWSELRLPAKIRGVGTGLEVPHIISDRAIHTSEADFIDDRRNAGNVDSFQQAGSTGELGLGRL